MLNSIPPTDPILLLATAECEKSELNNDLFRMFFGFSRRNRMEIPRPQRVSSGYIIPDELKLTKCSQIEWSISLGHWTMSK